MTAPTDTGRHQAPTVSLPPGVVTSFDHPPIPIRQFDWSATLKDYDPDSRGPDGLIGNGKTEQEAVDDLIEQLADYKENR